MKIEFTNTVDVGVITSGAVTNSESVFDFIVEWRLRTEPFLGMKQPTPQGGFLGSECILILENEGVKAKDYRFCFSCDGEELFGGILNDKGESGDLHVKMPYQGKHTYTIEVLEPIDEAKEEEPEHVYATPEPNS
jgi:hypothetical protein